MKYIISLCTIACLAFAMVFVAKKPQLQGVTHDYHGVLVDDPYFWLENPFSQETQSWLSHQTQQSHAYFEQNAFKETYQHHLKEIFYYDKMGTPIKIGDSYFYLLKKAGNDQASFYIKRPANAPEKLIDPLEFDPSGTTFITGFVMSPDAQLVAYGLSKDGSDWQEWHIQSVGGSKYSEILKGIKFTSPAWAPDNQGFFYCCFDNEETFTSQITKPKIFYHRVGTNQDDDLLIYERPDHPDWLYFSLDVTEDHHFLIFSAASGTDERNAIFYKDLQSPNQPVKELIPIGIAKYEFIGERDEHFFFVTTHDAPNGRIVKIEPKLQSEVEIIGQQNIVIDEACLVNDKIAITYLKLAKTCLLIFNLIGEKESTFFEDETATLFDLKSSSLSSQPELFYLYSDFTQPAKVMSYNTTTQQHTFFLKQEISWNPERVKTKQIFYASKDGTQIPMFLIYKEDVPIEAILEGKITYETYPVLLYGYGGFNISLTPKFSPLALAWIEQGGIFALPNIRGGGEFGKTWHDAGRLKNKQNVFDDFIGAAEWLIEKGITHPKKLGIYGRSNGGLLTGACLVQRPDLFGACIIGVGVLDMLRFHKFTIGWAWTSDYGSPDDPEIFPVLHAYSPYHNVKAGTHYPSTLILTGENDDRVVPLHSYKFTAALQAAQAAKNPLILYLEEKAGHGAGKSIHQEVEENAILLQFLATELDLNRG